KEKRALTYFRRGFFTLKASVAFDFVSEQVSLPTGGSRIQKSTRKSIVLEIIELNYISGGGPGVPVATNSVALQACPDLTGWESVLAIGGQTLTNKQRLTKAALEGARAAKTRRTASNSTGRTGNKLSAKTSASVPRQQPSIDKLIAFHEWQDSYWGRRHKYRSMDYEFPRGEFDVPPDQQAILRQIEATNNKNAPSSALDRQNDLPSFRSSQVITSTPLDAQRRPSSPSESHASDDLEDQPGDSNLDESAEDDDGDDKSEISQARRARSPGSELEDNDVSTAGSAAALGLDEAPDRGDGVEHDPQQSDAGDEKLLDEDDAISEKILSVPTANDAAAESEPLLEKPVQPRQPIVLVPDSDPTGSSQVQSQPSYHRGSSPWDIESSTQHSPEVMRSSSTKGKRRISPTLSSPVQPSSSLPNPSQLSGQSNDPQRTSASSGQGNSQESVAAASLPSPPPEHLPTQPTPSQPHARFDAGITNEPTARDQHGGNEQVTESFDTMPRAEPGVRTSPNRKKRRRSSSRVREGGLILASVGGVPTAARDPEVEAIKRRRLDDSSAHLTQERAAAREDISEPRVSQKGNANAGEVNSNRSDLNTPNPQNEGVPSPNPRAAPPSDPTASQAVIPHDHDAWQAPSYLTNQPKTPAKEESAVKGHVPNSSRAASISSSITSAPGPSGRRVVNPKRAALPPFGRSVVNRAISPELPPITASQVADADEDAEMQPLPALKIEPPTPARPTKSRASILSTTSSRSRPRASYAGSSSTKQASTLVLPKVGRASLAAAPRVQEDRVHSTGTDVSSITTAKPRTRDEPRPSKPRVSDIDAGKTKSGGKNTKEPTGGSRIQRKLLGGFKPSTSPVLEDRFISTWAMWLDSVREAELFWEGADL
ncbi:hypothetical protein FRC07_012808, partial [Ceratobasidium sp. 392]